MDETRKPAHAAVIFDSKFGNTAAIAKSLAAGLHMAGIETACFSTGEIEPDSLASYDLIAIGAPTQAFTASKPMKEFLNSLEGKSFLKEKRGFAFDTRIDWRFSGSASKFIEKRMSQLGMHIVKDRQSAIVKDSEGPLAEGEAEAFERIGFDVGNMLTKVGS